MMLAISICRDLGAFNSDVYSKCLIGTVICDETSPMSVKQRLITEYTTTLSHMEPFCDKKRLNPYFTYGEMAKLVSRTQLMLEKVRTLDKMITNSILIIGSLKTERSSIRKRDLLSRLKQHLNSLMEVFDIRGKLGPN